MAKHWNDDQKYLLKVISEYRSSIEGKSLKDQKNITASLSHKLHQDVPDLQHRTPQSINERLPYLDNLLAGVFEIHNYAKKDQHLYLKQPRSNDSREANLCNTRHSYNGAIR